MNTISFNYLHTPSDINLRDEVAQAVREQRELRITSYNVCYTKLLRPGLVRAQPAHGNAFFCCRGGSVLARSVRNFALFARRSVSPSAFRFSVPRSSFHVTTLNV